MTSLASGSAASTDEVEVARSTAATSFRMSLSALSTYVKAFSTALVATTGTFSGAVSMTALTATTGAFSGAVTASGMTLGGATPSAGWFIAANTKGLLVANTGGSNKVAIQLDATNVWRVGDGLPIVTTAAFSATTGAFSGAITVTGAGIQLDNNQFFKGKRGDGISIDVIGMRSATSDTVVSHGGGAVIIRDASAAQDTFSIDGNAVGGNIRMNVWDNSAAALVRVSRGAIDSGGAGFRLLRIPN